jgi:alpha-ketoglutarate-dependent taurine dioxygenase
MSKESGFVSYSYPLESKGIFVIEANNAKNPLLWLQENRSFFEEMILKFGGVLMRNFDIYSLSDFNRLAQHICPDLLNYTYRSTPRTNLGGKIFSATEYPADESIPMHNENSYAKVYPKKIMFFCAVSANEGGETPVADSRKVFNKINRDIVEKFNDKGILYIRNYTPGIDLSWQDVFQTSNREDVEKYCSENGIQYSWNKEGPELTTSQVCRATVTHPITKEEVWFNQAHLFHITSLKKEISTSLLAELGEKKLPRNAYYGDGSPIEEETLIHIRDIYEQESIIFAWKRGDIMILDNLLMAHGRKPYSGERKLAVAMG